MGKNKAGRRNDAGRNAERSRRSRGVVPPLLLPESRDAAMPSPSNPWWQLALAGGLVLAFYGALRIGVGAPCAAIAVIERPARRASRSTRRAVGGCTWAPAPQRS